MPTYEYRREDGTLFEVFQPMSDDALTNCPETGQPVKRIISGGSGIVYKGTGFYNTDYKDRGSSTDCTGSNGNACGCAHQPSNP
jgi:putative FmdB family regulatory protein